MSNREFTSMYTTKPKNWGIQNVGNLIKSGYCQMFNNLREPLSASQRARMSGQYPYYGAASAIDNISDYRFDGFYLLVAEDGTVTMDGTSPMLQLVRGKFWVSNHSHVLQGIDERATRFLYYLLKNVSIRPYVTGAVQPKLSKANLLRIEFAVPVDIKERESIVHTLSCLDDKIELLRKHNDTLEQIAQTIFKEWFVELNFPDKNGKPYKGSGGKLVDSELGPIPERWKVGVLSDEFNIVMGQSPPGASYNTNSAGMLFFQGVAEFGSRFPTARLYTTEPKKIAEQFDVLVSVRAPVGQINVAPDRLCMGRGLAAVRSVYKSYALYKTMSLQERIARFDSEGTVFGAITKDGMENLQVVIPEMETVRAVDEILLPIDAKIFHNQQEIVTLAQLRDVLLPKLLSGQEIRVGQ